MNKDNLGIYDLSNGKSITSLSQYATLIDEYQAAFQERNQNFFNYYATEGPNIQKRILTRGEFWDLALKAAGFLNDIGLTKGCRIVQGFTSNSMHDLIFRLGAAFLGCVPVTTNWETDDNKWLVYKTTLTEARLILYDEGFSSKIGDLRPSLPGVTFFKGQDIEDYVPTKKLVFPEVTFDDEKMIVFTSGTTGKPRGVSLPHRSYLANRLTFEKYLVVSDSTKLDLLLVNPMHHTNSSALTDWGFRRPDTIIHLVQRYGGNYWKILTEVREKKRGRLVTSLVARHIDFLESLVSESKLPVPEDRVKEALRETEILIGSAPVGPTSVKRIVKYAGHMPYVRFGSTETCLQVMGTPLSLSQDDLLKAFQAGWSHRHDGGEITGYYIGRPHFPYTRVKVVKSTDPASKDYFRTCEVGEPGYLVTQGANIMTGYVGDNEATRAVFKEGWYTGLRDIGFALRNEADGEPDFYWMSRDSELLIRGGAKYAYERIAEELSRVLIDDFGLKRGQFKLAVVGLRLESEHDDSCCVTIELDESVRGVQKELEARFIEVASKKVSKGARPHHVRFAKVPVSFKGAILYLEMEKEFRKLLKPESK